MPDDKSHDGEPAPAGDAGDAGDVKPGQAAGVEGAAPGDAKPGQVAGVEGAANAALGDAGDAGDAKPEVADAASGVQQASRKRRNAVLAGAGAVVVLGVIAIVLFARPNAPASAPGGKGSGSVGAAIRVPALPSLAPHGGVKLTGFVVDGAGLPVSGAEVSAELEHGAPDRALAPRPASAAGSGSGSGCGSGSGAGSGSISGAGSGSISGAGSGSISGAGSGSISGAGSGSISGAGSGSISGAGSGSISGAGSGSISGAGSGSISGAGSGSISGAGSGSISGAGSGSISGAGSGSISGAGSGPSPSPSSAPSTSTSSAPSSRTSPSSAPSPSSRSGSAAPASAPAAIPVIAPATGPDGRFVLDGLTAGRYRLRVTGDGLLPAEVRYVPVPSDEARIVVARQVAIEGIVTDGGKPVANAQVGLRGDAIGGTIEQRTSPTGSFKFPSLPEGRYQLFAWQAALAARTVRVARLGAGPFAPVELRLEAAAIVVGRVIDRDEGTGLVAAIELRPSGDDQAPRYARSGDDGVFRIEGVPNGKWIADAFVPGYLSSGGVELEAGRGVAELALVRGGAIEGRIVDGEGHPVAGATVRALTGGQNPTEISSEVDRDKLRRFSGRTAAPIPITPAGQGDDPQLIARGELGVMVGAIPPVPTPGAPSAQVAQVTQAVDPSLVGEPPALPDDLARGSIWTTGADGVYRIRGLGPAKVTVLATASGFAEARSRQVAVEPGQIITGVDLVLTPGTMIVGKVTDQHGSPVVGAQVTATPSGTDSANPSTSAPAGIPLDTFTDEAGDYKLGPVTGTVELRATAYGHGDARRTLELAAASGTAPGERREDLVLAVADAAIAGILEDAAGAAVAGAHLDVVGGVSEGRHAIAAADGTFALDMLPAGHLRLHVEHPDYPPTDLDVVAESGHPASLHLRLPLGGGIEGALLDAASGAPIANVTLAAGGPNSLVAEASTDQAGRWKLGPLRPGHWRIAVRQPGYLAQSQELDVPVARTPGATSVRDVRLELRRGALLGGTVRDARGQRMPGAHVVANDGTGLTCDADADAQGEFRIHDCPTGDLDVAASKADLRGDVRVTVRPGDEVLSLAVELR